MDTMAWPDGNENCWAGMKPCSGSGRVRWNSSFRTSLSSCAPPATSANAPRDDTPAESREPLLLVPGKLGGPVGPVLRRRRFDRHVDVAFGPLAGARHPG